MFQFLMGVAFGAAGYWAWESFGRDLLGMGGDQDTTYGGFNSGSGSNPLSSDSTSTPSSSSTGGSFGGSTGTSTAPTSTSPSSPSFPSPPSSPSSPA